jgi:hypothetical protein
LTISDPTRDGVEDRLAITLGEGAQERETGYRVIRKALGKVVQDPRFIVFACFSAVCHAMIATYCSASK